MSVRLNQLLASNPNDAEEQKILTMLQGSILKSHSRKNTTYISLHFDPHNALRFTPFCVRLEPLLQPQAPSWPMPREFERIAMLGKRS
jgi:hypothetical protein